MVSRTHTARGHHGGGSRRWTRWWEGRFGRALAVELLLVVGMYEGYRLVRRLTRDEYALAFRHADQVMAVERLLSVASEDDLQRLVLAWRPLVWVLNRYYVYGHFVPSVALLVWLYAAHRPLYPKVRNAAVATTVAALVLHVGYPLAPPRMLPGFVDTVARFGPAIYHSGQVASVANQIAAMPSLHFGWAALAAWAVVSALRHPLRWLALAHPAIMLVTIVATANHWWVDAGVAALLVLVATRVDWAALPTRLGVRRAPALTLAPAVDARPQEAHLGSRRRTVPRAAGRDVVAGPGRALRPNGRVGPGHGPAAGRRPPSPGGDRPTTSP